MVYVISLCILTVLTEYACTLVMVCLNYCEVAKKSLCKSRVHTCCVSCMTSYDADTQVVSFNRIFWLHFLRNARGKTPDLWVVLYRMFIITGFRGTLRRTCGGAHMVECVLHCHSYDYGLFAILCNVCVFWNKSCCLQARLARFMGSSVIRHYSTCWWSLFINLSGYTRL